MRQQLMDFASGAAGWMVLSCAARALPEPQDACNPFYLFFYRFSHLILANLDRVSATNSIKQDCPKP